MAWPDSLKRPEVFLWRLLTQKPYSTRMQCKREKILQQVQWIGMAESSSEPLVLCPFQQVRWRKRITAFGTASDFLLHAATMSSAFQTHEENFIESFAVGTAPKSTRIFSSIALYSWWVSLIPCSSINQLKCWRKIHLIVFQLMNAGLSGCPSLAWKITFLLKR